MLQRPVANNISTAAVLTATAPQLIAWGFIRDLGGVEISWLGWLLAQLPIVLLTLIAAWLIGIIIWPPEVSKPMGGLEKIREEMKKLGPVTYTEKYALAVFLLTVFLWSTDKWHTMMFGVKIPYSLAAVIAAILLFLPKYGILSWEDAKIPWDLMVFSAGAYAVGLALEQSGAARWMAMTMIDALHIPKGNAYMAFAALTALMLFSHILFSSKTVRTMIFIPLYIALAKAIGVPVAMIAIPAAFVIAWTISLPFNCKPNVIYFSTGYFNVLEEFAYGMIVCIVGLVLYLTFGWWWFNLLGSMGIIPWG